MRTERYPSDLTDQQWALVEPLIPVYPGGRPRKTPMRDVLDAILYVVRTGCQWRYLPKDFPPPTPGGTSPAGGRSRGNPAARPASTANRSIPVRVAKRPAGTTPKTSMAG